MIQKCHRLFLNWVSYGTVELVVSWSFLSMVSSWKVAKSFIDIIPNSINWLGAARTDITIRIR